MKVKVRANAKINLALNVIGKRDNGYHLIDTVMQSVSLSDTVSVSEDPGGEGITVICSQEGVPLDNSNITAKAAFAFFEAAGMECPPLLIKIKKRIPLGAGLAGGSADGAAVLTALEEIYRLGFTGEKLRQIAENVGADIPFCVTGGTMLARGTGTILSPLENIPEHSHILIVKPEFSVSTSAAYSALDSVQIKNRPKIEEMCQNLSAQDLTAIGEGLCNVFEEALPEKNRAIVDEIKHIMLEYGALGSAMSGSGSSVFGIFDDKYDSQKCFDTLKKDFDDVYLCMPEKQGCEIL